jgi:hypothetical protein
MAKQIDSLKHEDATASGRKIVQLIQALQEVQGKIETAKYEDNKWSQEVICLTVSGGPSCSGS